MSRIEKAIEAATKLRGAEKDTGTTKISSQPARPDTFKTETPVKTDNPCLVTITDPDSPITEEYRKLKSMIVKLTKQKGFQNTLMITSSLSGEGKSITAINLAVTLAQEYDHTVLLIDADMRRPSLHGYLNITPKTGLSDCLIDGLDINAALIKTGIGKLSFLPAGRMVDNPAELLSSQKMKELIDEIKHRYPDRYIVIDTPPVLPFAETLSISSLVDGIVLVVKEGMASLQNIRDALDTLNDGNILGIVYNNVSVENLNSSYYNNRYYYSAYKHHKKDM